MIRVLIADDEPLARERIRTLLEPESDIDVIGECSNGLQAVSAIDELKPDLVFLDVQMPEMSGFEVLETIATNDLPVVIFVTAFDQFALKAFEVHALDYLLKPFDRDRFQKALNRAKVQVAHERGGDLSQRLIALIKDIKPSQKYTERLVIKSSGRVFFLRVDEIDWIESSGNYLRLHVGTEDHLLRDTMNNVETKLDPEKFYRIHRSTIVNVERIKELQPWFRGDYMVILRDGTQLTLSRTYRDKLQGVL